MLLRHYPEQGTSKSALARPRRFDHEERFPRAGRPHMVASCYRNGTTSPASQIGKRRILTGAGRSSRRIERQSAVGLHHMLNRVEVAEL